ncbi:MAG: hypothetical protein QQN49_02850 [Nitrosopumilus sp.]
MIKIPCLREFHPAISRKDELEQKRKEDQEEIKKLQTYWKKTEKEYYENEKKLKK